jgi:hypothetical protein
MRRCVWLALLISLLGSQNFVSRAESSAAQDAKPTTSDGVPDREEYAAYAVLLKELFIFKNTKRLVINKHTLLDNMSIGVPKPTGEFSALSRQTADDFTSRNKQAYELSDQFNLDVKITFITSGEIKKMFQKSFGNPDGWETFHRRYPTANGMITLSRVGFNEDRSQALIFVGYGCGWLCGGGDYVLLKKKDGAWKIEAKSMTWVS